MTTGGADWTTGFTRSPLAAGVFAVAPPFRPAVRAWLADEPCPTAWSRDPHLPAIDAWALLDGGVLSVAHSGPTTTDDVPGGLYVVGFGAFRLLTAELGCPRPTRPLPGEPLYDLDELRCAHLARSPSCPDAREQAELLATCVDRRTLRWVATAFAAPEGRTLTG
jgi:hypothetical protein